LRNVFCKSDESKLFWASKATFVSLLIPQNGAVEMAVHEWLEMQETDLYGNVTSELMPVREICKIVLRD
jgi:hypothetical protein